MNTRQFVVYIALLAFAAPAMSADTIPTAECVDMIQETGAKDEGRGAVFDRYGDLLAGQGKAEAALRAYEKALLDGGIDGVGTTEKLALLQEKLGKSDEAIVSWQHLLMLKPEHPAAIDRLARLYMLRTSYKQALPLLQKLHEQQPDEACYAAMLGRVYLHERLIEPAEAAFTAAYKIDPTDRDVVANLGALYRYRGEQEEAAKLYKDYLIFDDSDREMRRLFVSQLIKLKRVDTDMLAMLELEARDEPSAATFYRLGVGYTLKGMQELAVQTFEKALALEPTHDKTLTALGRHYFLKGDYRVAKDYFTRVSQEGSEGDDADEYLRRIRLLTTSVDKKAVKLSKKSFKGKKTSKSAHKRTGQRSGKKGAKK